VREIESPQVKKCQSLEQEPRKIRKGKLRLGLQNGECESGLIIEMVHKRKSKDKG
jgi:hypothetical protein